MPPSNTPMGALFNLVTFVAGSIFSLCQIPQSVMAIISFQGATEVFFYGALGGIASLLAKITCEYCIKSFNQWWERNNYNQ